MRSGTRSARRPRRTHRSVPVGSAGETWTACQPDRVAMCRPPNADRVPALRRRRAQPLTQIGGVRLQPRDALARRGKIEQHGANRHARAGRNDQFDQREPVLPARVHCRPLRVTSVTSSASVADRAVHVPARRAFLRDRAHQHREDQGGSGFPVAAARPTAGRRPLSPAVPRHCPPTSPCHPDNLNTSARSTAASPAATVSSPGPPTTAGSTLKSVDKDRPRRRGRVRSGLERPRQRPQLLDFRRREQCRERLLARRAVGVDADRDQVRDAGRDRRQASTR